MMLYFDISKSKALELDFQSYVFGILKLFQDHHPSLFCSDHSLLVVKESMISLVIPSTIGLMINRKENYRFLSAGLSFVHQSFRSINNISFKDLPERMFTFELIFNSEFQNPLFKKKCRLDFTSNYDMNYDMNMFLDKLENPSEYLFSVFSSTFLNITPYNGFYLYSF